SSSSSRRLPFRIVRRALPSWTSSVSDIPSWKIASASPTSSSSSTRSSTKGFCGEGGRFDALSLRFSLRGESIRKDIDEAKQRKEDQSTGTSDKSLNETNKSC